MTSIQILDVSLYGKPIGTLTNLPGDKNLFTFNNAYIDNTSRPTLSLSFNDVVGELITYTKPTQTRLPSYFSNLLPEGTLRDFLAEEAECAPYAEFSLLQALGEDLPGAVQVFAAKTSQSDKKTKGLKPTIKRTGKQRPMHFSLAGVQLKFSAHKTDDRLTISVDGTGGSWIVKLPSIEYADVSQNEFVMMQLARAIGIDVPETHLVALSNVSGIPKRIQSSDTFAYAIKRFDRTEDGSRIHIEDFAQIFGIYPEKKYHAANYRNIAEVIWAETGEKGITEYIRRLVFTILIGNGDMHLKNWSLIYKDTVTADLSPAYDLVSTLPYIPDDALALNFLNDKSFYSIDRASFKRFVQKASLPEKIVLDTVDETIEKFFQNWPKVDAKLLGKTKSVIDQHLEKLPKSFLHRK